MAVLTTEVKSLYYFASFFSRGQLLKEEFALLGTYSFLSEWTLCQRAASSNEANRNSCKLHNEA